MRRHFVRAGGRMGLDGRSKARAGPLANYGPGSLIEARAGPLASGATPSARWRAYGPGRPIDGLRPVEGSRRETDRAARPFSGALAVDLTALGPLA